MTAILDNKPITWTSKTIFRIQLGRGTRGSYTNRYIITGSLDAAVIYYRGLNVGYGYKKRLLMENKVLAKYQS